MNKDLLFKLKVKIEGVHQGELRYARDYIALSKDIQSRTNKNISHATLKRLFHDKCRPRLQTLDILSHYCGHKYWENLLNELENQPQHLS